MLVWRLWSGPQGSNLLAPRAAQDPAHIIPYSFPHIASLCMATTKHDFLIEASLRATPAA
jgi:hypothetical protein